MENNENLRELIAEYNEDIQFYDGIYGAIIGICERINLGPVVAYSVEKIIEILMEDMEVSPDDLSEDETIEQRKYMDAYEWFEFNIKGGWIGEFTPVFIEKINN